MTMKYLLALICSAFFLCANGQINNLSLSRNTALPKQLAEAIDQRCQQDIKSLSGRKHKNEIAEIFKQRAGMVKEMVDEKEIITDPVAVAYLENLAQTILKNNPALTKQPLRILFSRAYWPNAASLGEGTIVFHIGLFNRLENEAQAAFILSHELAHYFLDHGNASVYHYVEKVNSEEFQQRLKEIAKSEFNRNSQLEKLGLNFMFNSRRHSRTHEKQADSMAFELIKNTPYNLQSAISSIALLDSADKDKYAGKLALEQQLNFAAYPFKKRWVTGNTLAFAESREDVKEKAIADSLKTHPDCKLRFADLEEKLKKANKPGGQNFIVSEAQFRQFSKAFDDEVLAYCFEQDKISRCLYLTLQRLSGELQNPYLLGMAGKCLTKLYTAQKDHTLGKYTDLPGSAYDEEYNSLLKAIQNWRLGELAAISYYFMQTHTEAGKSNEDFLYALIKSKEAFDKPEEKKEWITYYYQHFPKHKYNF